MSQHTHLAGLVTFCFALLVGCGPSASSSPDQPATSDAGPAAPAQGSKGAIGVSVLTLTNPFFKVIGQHITAEMEKAGYRTIVVSGDQDIAKQQQEVSKAIAAFDKAAVDELGAAKAKLVQALAKMKAQLATLKAKVG